MNSRTRKRGVGIERVGSKIKNMSGFTLIELLAVMAVVAILMGLLFGVLSKVRTSADLAGSLATLRNIGHGISLYTTDNEGFLPGPLNRGQWAVYGLGSNSLLYHIGEYMGLGPRPTAPGERRFVDLFACPGWKRNVSSEALRTDDLTVVWWLNMEAAMLNTDARREPWGWPSHDPNGPNAHRRHPVKLINIAEPSRQMAMQSVDAEIGPWARIPKKPVFGKVRTRLYFDGSAGTVPVEAGTNVFWPAR
jgi:prepilin-type N-terminal cleavage/methylation domain-containing protein